MNPVQSISHWVKVTLIKTIAFSLCAIVLNRLFVLIFGASIWVYPWVSISWVSTFASLGVYGLFLVIFPVLYIRELKSIVTIGTIKSLWYTHSYDIADTVVERVCEYCVGYTGGISEGVKAVTSNVDHLFDALPRIARKIFKKIQDSIPLIDEVLNILRRLDLDAIGNSKQLKAEVMEELEPFLENNQGRSSLYAWGTFVVNMLLMVFVFLVVKGYLTKVIEIVMGLLN